MLKNRIIYIAVLLLLVLFRIAYTGYVAGMLLLMAVILPFFSWLVCFPGALGTTIRLTVPDDVTRGSTAEMHISLRQSPLFITGPVKGKIKLINMSNQSVEQITMNSGKRGILLNTGHCCTYQCTFRAVHIYDLLGLLPLPARKPAPFSFSVLPIPYEPAEHPDWTSGSSMVAKTFSGGSNPYDLRDYRTGDTLRSIHWKKSASYDRAIVMDTLEPAERIANIWIEWPETGKERDMILDQLAWCIIYLKQNNSGINVRWIDSTGHEKHIFSTLGQLDTVISNLLLQPSGNHVSSSIIGQHDILLLGNIEEVNT